IVGLEAHDMLTAGGGAVLMAFEAACARRLQALVPEALAVDMLPDMNAALACVQVKQQEKNIALRRAIYDRYSSALLRTRHGTLHRCEQLEHSAYAFPVVLASDLKEVTRYVRQASIEISPAFEHSIVAAFQLPAMRRRWPFPQFLPTSASHTAPFQGEDREVLETTQGAEKTCQDSSWEREVRASEITPEMCWPHASALLLRCVRFPLYPRLAPAHAQEIARILGTLP
ncbi:DegT/DnrJ/EryC1/StrS family aminotransferase, partial [Treponema pallidum]